VGPYRILREIGRGGQGAVYLAEDVRLGRQVALKVLASPGDLRPDTILRFHREAAVASRLDHPGICAVFDVGHADGASYIAMRHVEGESLARLIAASREASAVQVGLPPQPDSSVASGTRRLVELVARVARAVHVAHESGIVHRDIKPGNIMVGQDGRPVILDFGIAREESPTAATLTGTGELFGTPAYLAAEQIEPPQGGIDRRVDVYALGVTLHECLTLRRPFDAPTRAALYQRITSEDPADPRRLNPAISRDLAVCVLTALERERDRRYQTAAAFADDLEAILEGRPIAARPVGAASRCLRWAKREPARALVVALLAIGAPALAALGSYVYATRDSVIDAARTRRLAEVEARLERGYFELGEGDAAQAGRIFEEALRLDPDSVEAIVGSVLALREQRRDAEALASIERHRSRPIANVDLPGLLDALRMADKQPAEPKTALEAFLAGTFALQEHHRGRVALDARALGHFEWAILNSPHARALFYMQAMHAALHVEDAATIARLSGALQRLWPEAFMTRFYAASGLRFLGAMDDAIRLLEGLARERPDLPTTLVTLGAAYASSGRHEDSARAYAQAVARSPMSAAARRGLGLARLRLERPAEAVTVLREAVSLATQDPLFRASLAEALFAAGDIEGGIAEYRESLRLGPARGWELRHGLAVRLQRAGRIAEAVEEHRKVVELWPTNPDGWMHLGIALSNADGDDEARRAFERVLELRPGDADALSNIGVLSLRSAQSLRDRGALAEALVAAEETARLRPAEADSHFVLGTVREKLGDQAGAAGAYAEATRLEPGYAEAWCNLGLRVKHLGRFAEALPALRKGHEIGSTRPSWRHPSATWIASCERLARKDAALGAVLRGESRPSTPEGWLDLAKFARGERSALDEAEVLSRALAAASDPESLFQMRVRAAQAALRVARPVKPDRRAATRPVSADERGAWALAAHGFLAEQLASIEARVAAGEIEAGSAREMVSAWLEDPDLGPLRDPAEAGPRSAESWRVLRGRIDRFLAR
jgi:tetratricopeptide (TPR) repeat protein